MSEDRERQYTVTGTVREATVVEAGCGVAR